MTETRHGSIDSSAFLGPDVGKISTGLGEVFILPTRSVKSCREMTDNMNEDPVYLRTGIQNAWDFISNVLYSRAWEKENVRSSVSHISDN